MNKIFLIPALVVSALSFQAKADSLACLVFAEQYRYFDNIVRNFENLYVKPLQDEKTTLNDHNIRLANRVKNLREELRELEAKQGRINKRLNETNRELAKEKAKNPQNAVKIAALEEDVKSLTTRLTNVTTEITTQNAEIATAVADRDTKTTANNARIAEINQEIGNLNAARVEKKKNRRVAGYSWEVCRRYNWAQYQLDQLNRSGFYFWEKPYGGQQPAYNSSVDNVEVEINVNVTLNQWGF